MSANRAMLVMLSAVFLNGRMQYDDQTATQGCEY